MTLIKNSWSCNFVNNLVNPNGKNQPTSIIFIIEKVDFSFTATSQIIQ